jgi:hypothetical protein
MVLRNVFVAITCALLVAWSGVSVADDYRPDQLLGLDLSKAVLSPKPLGPPAEFWPVSVEARGDRASEGAQAAVEPMTEPRVAVREPKVVIHETPVIEKTSAAHLRAEKPHGAARTKLARRHGNPLDAQAFDTRVQVWPCKSGGICNWKR